MIRVGVGAVLALLLLYGGIKAFPLLRGPSLSIEAPRPYESITNGLVTVSGVAHHTENLYLNDGLLPIDPEGRFAKTLALPSGGSVLKFVATDRFGRNVTEYRSVYIP